MEKGEFRSLYIIAIVVVEKDNHNCNGAKRLLVQKANLKKRILRNDNTHIIDAAIISYTTELCCTCIRGKISKGINV